MDGSLNFPFFRSFRGAIHRISTIRRSALDVVSHIYLTTIVPCRVSELDKVTVGRFSPSHFSNHHLFVDMAMLSSTLLHMFRLLPKPQHDPNLLPKPNVLVL
jgi:hypothetical protein